MTYRPVVPVSDVIPLIEWLTVYHRFRAELDQKLTQTGVTLVELHTKKLGSPTSPDVWEGADYRVHVKKTISFEVLEGTPPEQAFAAFNRYQTRLLSVD